MATIVKKISDPSQNALQVHPHLQPISIAKTTALGAFAKPRCLFVGEASPGPTRFVESWVGGVCRGRVRVGRLATEDATLQKG